jgi:hypothetical protein
MRFFCTCDCRKTASALADATAAIDRLQRQYQELDGLYSRLQGRYARTFRGDPSPEAPAAEAGNGSASPTRGNPQALELLRKRRSHVPIGNG